MIDSYSFGRIVVDGEEYTSDVIIFPDRVQGSWWREEGHSLSLNDLKTVLDFRPGTLVVGVGYSGMMRIPESTKKVVEARGIELIAARSSQAVDEYNRLCASGRVVGAFHLTC